MSELSPARPNVVGSSLGTEAPEGTPADEPRTWQHVMGRLAVHGPGEQLTANRIAQLWETQGAVKEPPRFIDQAHDPTRTATFQYVTPPTPWSSRAPMPGQGQEADGLRELDELLLAYLGRGKHGDAKAQREYDRAADLHQNLTFIGDREYQEAAWGIGRAWLAYLDADPRNQLCVLTEVGSLEKYRGAHKSDVYLRDQIIATFSAEERERCAGRVVGSLGQIPDQLQQVRAVILDDWTISGRQMRDVYATLLSRSASFRALAAAGQVEINVLAASDERIRHGLLVDTNDPAAGVIPIRAYYRAHYAPTARSLGYSIISGVRSAVNYGFGSTCELLVTRAQWLKGRPHLAHVLPVYRGRA